MRDAFDTNGSELVDYAADPRDRAWLGCSLMLLSGCAVGAVAYAIIHFFMGV